jgi:hypothetical protein
MEELQDFQHLNSIHKNIRFTMEIEENGRLPFLDVLVTRNTDGSPGHSVPETDPHGSLPPCKVTPPPFIKTCRSDKPRQQGNNYM